MRPRHYCRGRRYFVTARYHIHLSFNEAAALLLREASDCRAHRDRARARFNEAAALLPREAARSWRSAPWPRASFNEAAALLPREALVDELEAAADFRLQ